MKYLTDKAFSSFIFTENFECNEIKSRISPKYIIFGKGHLYEGHCAKCNQNIDINLIYNGINQDTIIKCNKLEDHANLKYY